MRAALPTITSQFQEKESKFWNSALTITGLRPDPRNRLPALAVRQHSAPFCSGDVMLSDGKMRTVHYSIIEDGGFAGFGQGVEWCVTGLDRNWAYNPGCKAARP